MSKEFVLGCDVGTGSVRVGLFDIYGTMISVFLKEIHIWHPESNFVEQSSDNIWSVFCTCVKEVIKESGVNPQQIKGLGFDATCSLVVLDEDDMPLSVSPTNSNQQNIIVWMDHRALKEAEDINRTRHDVLQYVGGTISPEMQTPKLLWLKRNKPDTWKNAKKFLDLSDYMVYRATGTDVRSVCTTTCKWTYLAHENFGKKSSLGSWDASYFNKIGLEEIVDQDYKCIGQSIRPVGEPVGNGLTEEAAEELGLPVHTAVGVAIIDAHAGGIGLLGMGSVDTNQLNQRLALIGGTSSCHMVVSSKPCFIKGIWGPYYSAMVPGMWLNEGGQSATGALIDHIIFSSAQSNQLKEIAQHENKSVYLWLNDRLSVMAKEKGYSNVGLLTHDLHLLPYFHGNRSPRADPSLTGSICGLHLSSTIDDLALIYLATIQAIAYGTRHIIEVLNKSKYAIDTIVATGGGTKNELFLQEHADITRCNIVLAKESEAVLLGSAILGAVAGDLYPTVQEAMKGMESTGEMITPKSEINSYHQNKYQVFKKMYEDEISYRKIMQEYAE